MFCAEEEKFSTHNVKFCKQIFSSTFPKNVSTLVIMFHITSYDSLYRNRLTSSMYYDPKLVTTTKKQIQNMQLKLIHVILTS